MSIKIYHGLRVKASDIGKFIKIFDKRCLDHLEKQTKGLMTAIKEDIIIESAEKAIGVRKDVPAKELLKDRNADDFFRYLEVVKIYIKSIKRGHNFVNPDSWFNAFPYKDYFYIVPGYPTGLNKVKYPNYVEEFGFWNNTDPPDDISFKDWLKRGDLWKKSGAFDIPMSNKLTHDLISKDDIGSLIAVEKRVRDIDAKINGSRPFPATYTAEARLEE